MQHLYDTSLRGDDGDVKETFHSWVHCGGNFEFCCLHLSKKSALMIKYEDFIYNRGVIWLIHLRIKCLQVLKPLRFNKCKEKKNI